MVNLVGGETGIPKIKNLSVLEDMPDAYLHWYEKNEVRVGRKMGHMTVLGENARAQAEILADNVTVIDSNTETL